jgi:hypothetical protein
MKLQWQTLDKWARVTNLFMVTKNTIKQST